MHLKPNNISELSHLLACAHARGETVSSCDLSGLNRIVDHTPEDMTVTVEAGLSLAALQEALGTQRQWLPVDPPRPQILQVGELLALDVNGPRRFGYGTVRDYIIGLTVVLADGRVTKSGGKVVKNVAGYDLPRLFVGNRNSLGIITEATFKLRPLPEAEAFVEKRCGSLDEAESLIDRSLDSELTPVVVDLHRLTIASQNTVVLGFDGNREEVAWNLEKARALGFQDPSSLEYEASFWNEQQATIKESVLPSSVIKVVRSLEATPFIARAGNGIIYHRNSTRITSDALPIELMRRLKKEFDPNNILPEMAL